MTGYHHVMTRAPTDEEFAAYDGMHCAVIWRTLPKEWKCPVCDRSKREILIWGKRKGANAIAYGEIGFKAGIHAHHDHGDIFAFGGLGRFETTYLCGACNNLDARLKRKLGTICDFSFSSEELRSCLLAAKPNEGLNANDIDFEKARAIYVSFIAEQARLPVSFDTSGYHMQDSTVADSDPGESEIP